MENNETLKGGGGGGGLMNVDEEILARTWNNDNHYRCMDHEEKINALIQGRSTICISFYLSIVLVYVTLL
jgi:hypothetical protein